MGIDKRWPYAKEDWDEFHDGDMGDTPVEASRRLSRSDIKRRTATDDIRANAKSAVAYAKTNRRSMKDKTHKMSQYAETAPVKTNMKKGKVQSMTIDDGVMGFGKIGTDDIGSSGLLGVKDNYSGFDNMFGVGGKSGKGNKKYSDGLSKFLGF